MHLDAVRILSTLLVLASLSWSQQVGATLAPSTYVADFVSTAAFGASMNDSGDVTGTSYPDPGCGWSCLPTLETVAWRGGSRIVLPSVPGLSGITVRGINGQGWIAGFAGLSGTTTHAVVWKPIGNAYAAIDLGALPGTTISSAAGIDNLGRVVGYSTTQFFPPTGAPFVWTEAGGMVDLSAQGFPNESPLTISPGGTVALTTSWYRLDDPNSRLFLVPPPQGFFPPGGDPTAINDAGDQIRFLASTSSQSLRYLFRYQNSGVWQQLGSLGNGHLLPYGAGSVTSSGDLTATDLGTGIIAYGPNGATQSLAGLLSPAYQGAAVTTGGPINASGQVLAQVMIGNSPRLMRLTPAMSCVAGCIRVNRLQIRGKFINDPNDPGHCTLNAKNRVLVKLLLTDENGAKLSGVSVSGRFLDDYWMNKPVAATSNAQGVATFTHQGLACVGAVAFLVDSATKGPSVLDRTTGVITGSVIPLP
jgi:probable HAF family extracellular repeat protein